MKKITLIIIAFAAFAFAGCTATREANTNMTTNANAATNANTATVVNKTEEAKPADTTASSDTAGMDSPTATMGVFFEALKKKDNDTIKKCLSKASLAKLEEAAAAGKTTIDQIISEGEDMSKKKTPAVRNEKIDGDSATLEVEDEETKKWDTVMFVKEDGAWKIALDKMQS